jgi:hypothetical protein
LSDGNGDKGSSLGGNVYRLSGPLSLHNTILSKGASGANFFGQASGIDAGYNLSSDGSCNFGVALHSRDNVNARLAPLANYGGPTATFALLTNSPAIDAGDPNYILATDQRGSRRPQAAGFDIGAYEFVPTAVIGGRISDGTNKLSGVRVEFSGRSFTNTVSGTNGVYALRVPLGVYSVTAGPSYMPSNQTVTNLSVDVTNLDFTFIGAKLSFPEYFPETNGTFLFLITGKPNQTLQVQRSTNLVDWFNYGAPTNPSSGVLGISGSNAAVFPQQFFRVIIP